MKNLSISALFAALASLAVAMAGPEFSAILPPHLAGVLALVAAFLQAVVPAVHDAEGKLHSGSRIPAIAGLAVSLVGILAGPAFAALLPTPLAAALALVAPLLQGVTGSLVQPTAKSLDGYVPGAPRLDGSPTTPSSLASDPSHLGPPASSYRGSGGI